MLLVGSKALGYYFNNLGRVTHDWDIYMSEIEYVNYFKAYKSNLVKETKHSSIFEKGQSIIEIKRESQFTLSDKRMYDACKRNKQIPTPCGYAHIPDIQFLYDLKKATAEFINEPKHKYDLELIEKNFDVIRDTDFYKMRRKETEERVSTEKKVKYDFFHKYHIPEYVVHDRLHDMIASLLKISMPTYQRITTTETDISEELFNKLSHEQKISLMVEESLVLNLERWFIPQMVEKGINHKLVDIFYNNNEAMPTYLILKHCCITGLKGEAEYITNFSRTNFFEIEKEWQHAKNKIKLRNGFPGEFYSELFDLRKKYKAGEKVGTV